MTAPLAKSCYPIGGIQYRGLLSARSERGPDGNIRLVSPAVGLWREPPPPGALVMPRGVIGFLEVLGVQYLLCADEHAHGLVIGEIKASRVARVPVEHGQILLELDPSVGAVVALEEEAERPPDLEGLAFRAPSSGRFYGRPAPDKPPFVEVGSVVEVGTTLCLLEIMKSFHRISYGASGLPARARISRVLHPDGADVEVGEVLFELADSS